LPTSDRLSPNTYNPLNAAAEALAMLHNATNATDRQQFRINFSFMSNPIDFIHFLRI
jgi:hypothetical protein